MILRLAFPHKDSQQTRKNNKKMILGDIVLAFQIGVPAVGFFIKRRNWKDELRGGVERLAFPLKDSH